MGEMRNGYRVLLGKLGKNKPFGRPRCRWKPNIKLCVKEIWCEVVDWFYLPQDRDQ
jgi:hypothetical protein